MKKIKLLLFVVIAFLVTTTVFAQKGIGTNIPERSSILELQSTNRGLLIPRVTLEGPEYSGMIAGETANSLLVYNTGNGTGSEALPVGFYYWVTDSGDTNDTGHWEAFLTNKNFHNKAGDGIYIDEEGMISINTQEDPDDPNSGNGTIEGGKVLVTVEEDGETHTEWIDQNDLLNNLQAGNGVEINYYNEDGELDVNGDPQIELGGSLTHNTTIEIGDNEFRISTIDGDGNGKNFFIEDLNEVTINKDGNLVDGSGDEIADPDDTAFQIMIVGDDGLVQKTTVADLIKNAIGAQNGLTWNDVENKVELGGNLIRDTEINLTDADTDDTDKSHNLVIVTNEQEDEDGDLKGNLIIEGLQDTKDEKHKNLVIDDYGTVRTAVRMLTGTVNEDYTIDGGLVGYTPFVQEIFLTAQTNTNDYTITLPEAGDANAGQVINITVSNNGEDDDAGYVQIDDGTGPVAEGYVDGRSWVFKSTGDSWLLVADN